MIDLHSLHDAHSLILCSYAVATAVNKYDYTYQILQHVKTIHPAIEDDLIVAMILGAHAVNLENAEAGI